MGEIRIPASSPKRPRLEEPQPEMEENKIPAEDQATESNIVPEGEATVEELPQPRGEVRQRDDQEPDQSGDGGAGDERESKRMRTEFIELYLNQIEKALAAKLKKGGQFPISGSTATWAVRQRHQQGDSKQSSNRSL